MLHQLKTGIAQDEAFFRQRHKDWTAIAPLLRARGLDPICVDIQERDRCFFTIRAGS